jgi:hypothetical protein
VRVARDPIIQVAIRFVGRARRVLGELSQETLEDILSLREVRT